MASGALPKIIMRNGKEGVFLAVSRQPSAVSLVICDLTAESRHLVLIH